MMHRQTAYLISVWQVFALFRDANVWMPDKEFYEKYDKPVLYPNEVTSQWKLPPINRTFLSFQLVLML